MKRIALCCLLILGLSACGGRTVYKSADRSPAQEEKDYYECRFDAEKSTGNLNSNDDREERVKSMIERCMRSRGYKK
jgi:hypothetical protein